MTTIVDAILLGIIQGISEWLPISSSGHLVLAQELLNIQVSIIFDLLLHIGSLVVVFLCFREEIYRIIQSLYNPHYYQYRTTLFALVIGTLVTGVIGITFRIQLTSYFSNTSAVGIGLLITTFLLIISRNSSERRNIRWYDGILIGLAQGIAIIPGVSRSGATISMGLLNGISRKEAARFSFLLFIPAILGALVLLILEGNLGIIEVVPSIISMITAMIVGALTLHILMKMIQDHKFHYFAWYTGVLGVVVLLL
jgi:undecaprenyl-diphosphatase